MNFEYIVVAPEKVLAVYQKASDDLAMHFEAYLAWAKDADAKYEAASKTREEAEEARREESRARSEQNRLTYQEKLFAWQVWHSQPWLFRLFEPEPEYPARVLECGVDLYGAYFYRCSQFGYHTSSANDLKTEVEDMIESAKAEPKEFHFTEQQFARMREWESGKVVQRVKEKMTNPVLFI